MRTSASGRERPPAARGRDHRQIERSRETRGQPPVQQRRQGQAREQDHSPDQRLDVRIAYPNDAQREPDRPRRAAACARRCSSGSTSFISFPLGRARVRLPALAIFSARRCSSRRSTMRVSTSPTSTSSSEPLQKRSTMRFTARAPPGRACRRLRREGALSTRCVRWPLASSRLSTVRTVDSLSGRDSAFCTLSAVEGPCSHTSCNTSRSRAPRSETLCVIWLLPFVLLHSVALQGCALSILFTEGSGLERQPVRDRPGRKGVGTPFAQSSKPLR